MHFGGRHHDAGARLSDFAPDCRIEIHELNFAARYQTSSASGSLLNSPITSLSSPVAAISFAASAQPSRADLAGLRNSKSASFNGHFGPRFGAQAELNQHWLGDDHTLRVANPPDAHVHGLHSNSNVIPSDFWLQLQMGDQLGTLEPGRLADVILLDGNPLEGYWNWLRTKVVVKGGGVVVDKR